MTRARRDESEHITSVRGASTPSRRSIEGDLPYYFYSSFRAQILLRCDPREKPAGAPAWSHHWPWLLDAAIVFKITALGDHSGETSAFNLHVVCE